MPTRERTLRVSIGGGAPASLAPGLYLVRATAPGGSATGRVVITK